MIRIDHAATAEPCGRTGIADKGEPHSIDALVPAGVVFCLGLVVLVGGVYWFVYLRQAE